MEIYFVNSVVQKFQKQEPRHIVLAATVRWKDTTEPSFNVFVVFLKGKQRDWNQNLQLLAGAIRSTENRNTGYSTNMLMFGREVQHPVDLLMGTSHARGNNKQPSEFIRDLKQVMEEVHSIVRENIQSAQFR